MRIHVIIFIIFGVSFSSNLNAQSLCPKTYGAGVVFRSGAADLEYNYRSKPHIKLTTLQSKLFTPKNTKRLQTPGLVKGDTNAFLYHCFKHNLLQNFVDSLIFCDSMSGFKYAKTDTCRPLENISIVHVYALGCMYPGEGYTCYLLRIDEGYWEGGLEETNAIFVNSQQQITAIYTLNYSIPNYGGNWWVQVAELKGFTIKRWHRITYVGGPFSVDGRLYSETISVKNQTSVADSFDYGGYFFGKNGEALYVKNDLGGDSVIYYNPIRNKWIPLTVVSRKGSEYQCRFPGESALYQISVTVNSKIDSAYQLKRNFLEKSLQCRNPDGTVQEFQTEISVIESKEIRQRFEQFPVYSILSLY